MAAILVVGLSSCGGSDGNSAMSGYTVSLLSGTNYAVNTPSDLRFDVQLDGKVFKNFAVDGTKLMHLIIVRKDRNYFQHVHPEYDESTSAFTMSDFQFPTTGQYRIFANFVPIGAAEDSMGMVESEAPHIDVSVGGDHVVNERPLGPDHTVSAQNGLVANIADHSATGTIDFSLVKDGVPFKALQPYLGSLGHMVVLGPNLEFIHAHPMSDDLQNQSGLIQFMVELPIAGQYKLYVQTQSNGIVDTFDFNMTVASGQSGGHH